jgi:hypothetical protein
MPPSRCWRKTLFPALKRGRLDTLQVNLGYRCNQSCLHCHVNAGPYRTEMMDDATLALIPQVLAARSIQHAGPDRWRPGAARGFPRPGARGPRPGRARDRPLQPDHPVRARVRTVWRSSWPASRWRWLRRCPATRRRMWTASAATACSTRALPRCSQLNVLGYGQPGSGRVLNLVYNPQGPSLPPDQKVLQADYKRELFRALRHRLQ